jgi:hypothetical protein
LDNAKGEEKQGAPQRKTFLENIPAKKKKEGCCGKE